MSFNVQLHLQPTHTIPSATHPLFIFHHGGGHSGSSFSLVSKLLLAQTCNSLIFDCRGHGKTTIVPEHELSLEQLTADLEHVVSTYRGNAKDIILVGHSMGGAVVVELMHQRKIKGIMGCVVLDVVEGSALEALGHMTKFLTTRPSTFKLPSEAISWAIHSHQIKNKESAEISIPTQLVQQDGVYKWRTNLSSSSAYWEDWFKGLSEKFLTIPCAKMLVLAGTDRLDKPLTIGQMQGKFQLVIIPESGHCIQEDVPEKLAEVLIEFWKRNQPLDISKIKKFPFPNKPH